MNSKIGLFFGTFNPIHIGHLALANYLIEYGSLDEIWFVVTPHNPLKNKSSLLDDYQRLHMVNLAIEEYPRFRASSIEFNLPQPNYTVITLAHLEEKYPNSNFSLLVGEDNLKGFKKWKNYKTILERYQLIVYPRVSEGLIPEEFTDHKHIKKIKAPIIEVSSTLLRNGIAANKDLRYFLHHEVYKYIDEMGFYK